MATTTNQDGLVNLISRVYYTISEENNMTTQEVGLKQKFKTQALNLYIDTSNHTIVYSDKRLDLFGNDYLPIDDNAFQVIFKAFVKANIVWLEQRRKEIQQTIDYRSETLASIKLNRIAEIDDLIKELK